MTAANVNTAKLTMQAGLAGAVAVIPMTLCMLAGPVIGLPRVSLPELYAATMSGYWSAGAGTLLASWVLHVVIAAMLAIGYGRTVQRHRPQSGATLAAMYALGPWMLMQIYVLNAMARAPGMMSRSAWLGESLVTFAGWIVFGACTGLLLRLAVRKSAIPVVRTTLA